MVQECVVRTPGRGLLFITDRVEEVVLAAVAAGDLDSQRNGLCTVFLRHTSASLVIQENADPSVRRDLERWMARIAPDGDPAYEHAAEGPDDMPSHIRSVITATSLAIPVLGGRLALGTWQGVYLWEHRRHAHTRRIVVHVGA